MAWLSWFFYRLFTLTRAVWLLKQCSRLLSLLFHLDMDTATAVDASQRHQVRQIIHETSEEGLLSSTQKEMMSRLIDIPNRPVTEAMVGLENIEMVPVNLNREGLLEHLKKCRFTRQVVYRGSRNQIIGYIHIYQVLGKNESFSGLDSEVAPLLEIDRTTSIIDAINLLRKQHERIALVMDISSNTKRPVGIVAISDLIEAFTGEFS